MSSADYIPSFAGDCDDKGRIAFDDPQSVVRYCRAKHSGTRVDVTIRARKAQRSDRQNRAFWAAITPWARELGYTAEELKTELLGLLWGYDEKPAPLTGDVVRSLKKPHTSKLNTAEFAELMEFSAMKAAETGYYMPMPSEFLEARAKRPAA